MGDILKRNGIDTMAQLEAAMEKRMNPANLKLRSDPSRPDCESNTLIEGKLFSIMASDITLQTKVEFPLDCKHYYEFPNMVDPAQFVRASMAIPVFFEPFRLNVPYGVQQKSSLQKLKATEEDSLIKKDKLVRFVDGGILSNFPINVFHNPALKVARMATIGVKLEDEAHEVETEAGQGLQATVALPKNKKIKDTLMSMLGSAFSTVRFYYDREFLKRNGVYQQCIAHVDVENINWLNFGMDYDTQKDLFIRGAKAAEIFFCGGTFYEDGKARQFAPYDWDKFKKDRAAMVAEVQKTTGVSS
jgi:NTE family protein